MDTLAGMLLNVDARQHEIFVENMADRLGKTPEQIAQALREAAKGVKR